MSFSRVLCYPVKALGSVTINGSVITRGETIQQFGELRIDLGTYRQDDIVLYNDAQQWTPVSIEGNVLVFSILSNGKFYIYDNARKVVFEFTNNNQQDFTIESVGSVSYGEYTPIAFGIYYQWPIKHTEGWYFGVRSTGTSLDDLEVTTNNGTVVWSEEWREEFGRSFKLTNNDLSRPIEIRVGNVLVVYAAAAT